MATALDRTDTDQETSLEAADVFEPQAISELQTRFEVEIDELNSVVAQLAKMGAFNRNDVERVLRDGTAERFRMKVDVGGTD